MSRSLKVLQVANSDETVKWFLLPLIDCLLAEGYQIHIACSSSRYVPELQALGYVVHTVNIERRINPLSNLRSLWCLHHLMRKEQFDIVHVHEPVAGALGRVAAWAARKPIVIYTAHGFYFHEQMPRWARRLVVWVEKFLCCITDLVFTQSSEDAVTAVREAICPQDKLLCIGNGVDTTRFAIKPGSNGTRESLGLYAQDKVVGFVGRLVGEKGIMELGEAMNMVLKAVPDAKLLIVGDTLNGDRDKKAKKALQSMLDHDGLARRIVFTGFVEDVASAMAAIDVFVLPSHREGMPRTIIEAMASSKPVVATNIRGCREEVVNEVTGLLVPVKNPKALAEAIIRLLSNPELARQMGAEGRRQACEHFDERIVLDKQVKAYTEIIRKKIFGGSSEEIKMVQKRIQLLLKRAIDITLSSFSLTFLCIPFLVTAIFIKFDSAGSVFFHQVRIGKDGKPFRIWKFRTMVEGAINQGLGVNFAENDPRITRVGNMLREYGLDELPQLINVLLGEMSIVGPRPDIYEVERYDNFQRQRFLVRPGITSPAVVNGRNFIPMGKRLELDVWYINNWSLWLDLTTIFKTFWIALVSRQGIYGPGGINDDLFASTKASDPEQQNLGRQAEAD